MNEPAWKGTHVLFVGETDDGDTADLLTAVCSRPSKSSKSDAAGGKLGGSNTRWEVIRRVLLPSWPGSTLSLFVVVRRK